MRAVDADRLIAEVEKLRLHGYGSYVYGRNDTIDMVAKLIIAAPTADPDAEREERLRKFREMTNTAALNCDAIEIGLVQEGEPHGS